MGVITTVSVRLMGCYFEPLVKFMVMEVWCVFHDVTNYGKGDIRVDKHIIVWLSENYFVWTLA